MFKFRRRKKEEKGISTKLTKDEKGKNEIGSKFIREEDERNCLTNFDLRDM